jgi:hypothetical protein
MLDEALHDSRAMLAIYVGILEAHSKQKSKVCR